ncbi:MAG: VWA domain-containing protein, partial [Chloroflexi bacterium]|nr:VWA domain-containing protein [Chloroflexota bacterium]
MLGSDRLKQQDAREMQGEAVMGYTGEDILVEKDFSTFTDEDIKQLRRIIARLAPKLATTISRRTKVDRRGEQIDFRRTFRRNLKHGGDPLDLARKERKLKKLKVVLHCDVSGSMDRYSVFLIQVLYSLQRELRGLETFVFSTRLIEVTNILRTREFHKALDELQDKVDTWSGGTSIGRCLQYFNHRRAQRKMTTRTVVVVISDGWDKGDAGMMRNEMQVLKRRCYRIIWLNPLLGSPGYQPLAQGMQAALPYIDYFLPAHNLESLINLTKTLASLRRG